MERKTLKEIIARKDEESSNTFLNVVELQQQVEICRKMHDEGARMSSPASTINIPLENAAQGMQMNPTVIVKPLVESSTSGLGATHKTKRNHFKQKIFIYKRRVIVM